jgi:hypothetical protein
MNYINCVNLKKLFASGIIFLLITSTFLIFIPKIEAQNRFSGKGSGTPNDPYVITNVKQLQEMKYDLKAHYVLGNDIDASETKFWNNGQGFEPIGDEYNPFIGSFDGRGHKIYNLYIKTTRDYVGLFGYVAKKGIIKNVGLVNFQIFAGTYGGGLIGINFYGTVSNCYSIGSINEGGNSVGGLVGSNYGTVSNCYSIVSVEGNLDVGGLVGSNYGTVSNCYSIGSINAYGSVGGLIGWNNKTVSNCYSRANVVGEYGYIGGLIGANSFYGTVSNCYSTGYVKGGKFRVGGLIGGNGGKVSNSFWDIETSGLTTSDGGTGKTTKQMKSIRTYTDIAWSEGLNSPWDFVGNPYDDKGNKDIWDINPNVNDGYPYLTAIPPPTSIPTPKLTTTLTITKSPTTPTPSPTTTVTTPTSPTRTPVTSPSAAIPINIELIIIMNWSDLIMEQSLIVIQ